MRHAIWKLTALAGIVGIGLIVFLQAQQNLKTATTSGPQAADGSSSAEVPASLPANGPEDPFGQAEPVPASAKTAAVQVLENVEAAVEQAAKSGAARAKTFVAQEVAQLDRALNGRQAAVAVPHAAAPQRDARDPLAPRRSDPVAPELARMDDEFDLAEPTPRPERADVEQAPENRAEPLLSIEEDTPLPAPAPRSLPIREIAEAPSTEAPSTGPTGPRARGLPNDADDFELPARRPTAPIAAPSAPNPRSREPRRDDADDVIRIQPRSRPAVSDARAGDPLPPPAAASDDLIERPPTRRQSVPAIAAIPDEGDDMIDPRSPPASGSPRFDAPAAADGPTLNAPPARPSRPAPRAPSGPSIIPADDGDDPFPTAPVAAPRAPRPAPMAPPTPAPQQPANGDGAGDDDANFAPDPRAPNAGAPGSRTGTMPRAPRPASPPTSIPTLDPLGGDETDFQTAPAKPSREPAGLPVASPPATPAVPLLPDDGDAPVPSLAPPAATPDRPALPGSDGFAVPTRTPNDPGSGDDRPGRPTPQGAQRPHLTIDKVAPATAILGQPLVYQIVVRNTGSSPAYQVVVEDRVPRNVDLSGTNPQAELGGDRLVWRLGTMAPGIERRFAVRIVPTGEGVIGSVARVTSAAEVGAQTQVTAPRLKFDVALPRQAMLGAPVVVNFRISNPGRDEARQIYIRDILPSGLRHPDGDDLEFEVGNLPAGRSREVQLTLTAAQEGRAIHKAVVTADGGVEIASESEIEVLAPALTLNRTGPKRLFVGRTGTFVTQVRNAGPAPLDQVAIVEKVPAGVDFVDASSGGQFDPGRREVRWLVPRLDRGAQVEVTLRLTPRQAGVLPSVVRAQDVSGVSGEVRTTLSTAGISSLTLDMAELDSPLEVGERIQCRVRVFNRGSEAASNVRLAITLPASLRLLAIQGVANVSTDDPRIQLPTIERIDPRGQATFDLTLQATSAAEARVQALVQSDQMTEPLRTEQSTTIVPPND